MSAQRVRLPSRFRSPRRQPVRYIVLHTTEGTDSRTWLTETGNVSAHYLVREGVIYELVSETEVAWHAGIVAGTPTTPLYRPGVNPNDESIGIEMEGHAAQAVDPRTIAATAELIRDIRSRRGPLPIVDHAELSPARRTDPGPHNRAAVEAALKDASNDPVYLGASPAVVTLQPGEVGWLNAIFRWPDGRERAVTRKVYAERAGARFYTIYPPADPDADPTEDLDAQPAMYIVVVHDA